LRHKERGNKPKRKNKRKGRGDTCPTAALQGGGRKREEHLFLLFQSGKNKGKMGRGRGKKGKEGAYG